MLDRKLGQHHTLPSVAHLLPALMQIAPPKTVVDLGVGYGNLLHAAQSSWSKAMLYGVDVDSNSLEFARRRIAKAQFSVADCLSELIDPTLNSFLEKADVVLSNPPFLTYPRTANTTKQIEAEIKFLQLGLGLLRPGGSLGIILPAKFISGPAYFNFRSKLLQTSSITSVTQLPRIAFGSAEVDSYFLVLRKQLQTSKIILRRLDKDIEITKNIDISSAQATERMDYAYYARKPEKSSVPLALLMVQDVKRGEPSSGKSTPTELFHTTHFKFHPNGLIQIDPGAVAQEDEKTARKGDLLIPRIGTRCLHHCGKITKGATRFSDCVYRIRLLPEWRDHVFNYFRSPEGIESRFAAAHGSCVKILGKEALLDLMIPV
ncbi:methyltransferase [Aquidulcibacter sp.]|uniref:methyltransferase n=1 Tax=Aquidulcibacter sp. TaxID=2052990 RepID=UPI0028ADF5A3|nr:methyltransferase [Aquidulcibacter sp.]